MKFKLNLLRKLAIAGLLAGASVQASNDMLLDILVSNGTITQAQAAEVRTQLSQATQAAAGRQVVTPNRNTIQDLRIRGRIQGQFAYSDGSNSNTVADADDYKTFEMRRVRLGVQGKIQGDWSFLVEINALSTVDLDSATLSYNGFDNVGLTFGKAKPQFGHEENTSSASILTMERSRLTGLFNGGKPVGLRAHGSIDPVSYYVGVYNGQSQGTGAMGSNQDSFLFNASLGLKLDNLVGEGNRLRLRADYLHNDGNATKPGYYRFEDAVALSAHFVFDRLDIRGEYMWGDTMISGDTIRGFYIMPSFFFVEKKLQGVFRYENIKADDGVNLGANRYADRVPGLYRAGNRYDAFYVGLNYYIHGDNLKLMGGFERARSKDDSAASNQRGTTNTFISGVRMQF